MSQEPASKRARTSGTPMITDLSAPSGWTFTPKTTPKSTTAYITDESGKKIRVQLPRMRAPFGVQEGMGAASGSSDSQETQSRPNLELDVSDPKLVEWGRKVDAAAISYVAANSKELMKKTMKREFVEQIFRGVIPPARNEYNPLMRTKITRSGTYATKIRVVTDSGSSITPLLHREGSIADIDRNDEVIPIVDVTGIWFANNSAGVTLGLSHVLVYKNSGGVEDVFNIPGVAGVECVSDSAPAPEPPVAPVNNASDDFVASDPFA